MRGIYQVRRFALLMLEKLKQNTHKGGWELDAPQELFAQMHEEIAELAAELDRSKIDPKEVARECADVANFAMMIADVVGGLPEHPLDSSSAEVLLLEKDAEILRWTARVKKLEADLNDVAFIAGGQRRRNR